ncbi:heavy metal-binding domain-containing protein [Bacteroides uniformis]|uniref:heavy metal-binding domain-containing protein n=1 Tax=Bacteroides uniformis TaxID=820 RepID=UPI001896AA8C
MIITTTNNIENYSIKRYLGVVNANIVIGANFLCNSGKLSFVPYTKDFGRITRF